MKKTSLTLWLMIACVWAMTAQSPYQLKTGREIGLYGLGLSLSGTGLLLNKTVQPLTAAQIGNLRAERLCDFERWVTTRHSVRSRKASDVLLFSSQLFPVAMTLGDPAMRKDAGIISNIYFEAGLINFGLTTVVKSIVKRTRPYVYQSGFSLEEKMKPDARQSFWSGHTSSTATMCFLTAQMYSDYHPDSKWKPAVWGAAAAVPLTTGILRMTAGKHFPTDVISGYLTGAAIGLLLPRIHRRLNG
ncbi:MAG: phosphatase PAP2 family protein [Saprospiraceae bacterium]|nr:phosphatase PAP2 family protein [Saprospiraceae bacterium]